jgi:hypothetical protein
MRMYRWLPRAAATLIGILEVLVLTATGSAAHAATPATCDMRLHVVLTPDVPNPRDAGLLNSLLSDHPGYWLTLQRQDLDNASVIVVDLTGPGPEDNCRGVVKAMRQDARVWSVEVQRHPAGTADAAPHDQLFVYAKDGASYAQQASDRYECDISAVEQTGFDPTKEDGGVSSEAGPVRRAGYFRAVAACLAGRGYAVR